MLQVTDFSRMYELARGEWACDLGALGRIWLALQDFQPTPVVFGIDVPRAHPDALPADVDLSDL